jgi:hypothetical protein
MSFQPHILTEDELKLIYSENIDKIRKYDYSIIGLKDFRISENDITLLLNNFINYKIIGFNIGKFGDFEGSCFAPPRPGSCNWCYPWSNYYSFFIYIIYVDIVGNCYGHIQSRRVNTSSYEDSNGTGIRNINWITELFVKPFSIKQKLLDITTDFDLIMKCISKNRVLEYSYPEYKVIYKSYMGPCIKITKSGNGQDRAGFDSLIGITQFKNIGNKCNEMKIYKINKKIEDKRIEEDKKKMEEEKKKMEEDKKKMEEEKKKMEEEKKKMEEEKIMCKVNSLKPKYGDKIYYKFDEENKKILYIGYSNSEIIDLSDFIDYKIKKRIFRGRIIQCKIGNIDKIVFNNCLNLKRINDYVEGLNTISINNCPNISEIDCYDKIKKIWIDKECIDFIDDNDIFYSIN